MPSIEENRLTWGAQYDWSKGGDEWSAFCGGTNSLWWGLLFPRIRSFLPTGTILEIAPGFGRCTQFLAKFANRLLLVDLNERCIEACKARFAGAEHIEYHVNDGESLAMIPDGVVDLAFSYDSLVHAEGDQLDAYVRQLAQKLSPNGVAFLHHSNLGMFADPQTKALPFENVHWRATTMSAARLEAYCSTVGLQCVAQEMINWGGPHLTDCFSLITRSGTRWSRANSVRQNPAFDAEAANLAAIAELYGAR